MTLTWKRIPKPSTDDTPWMGVTWIAALQWRWQGHFADGLSCPMVRPIGLLEHTSPPNPAALALADPKTVAQIRSTFEDDKERRCCPRCQGLALLNVTTTGDERGYIATFIAGKPWYCPACDTSTSTPVFPHHTAHDLLAKEAQLTQAIEVRLAL